MHFYHDGDDDDKNWLALLQGFSPINPLGCVNRGAFSFRRKWNDDDYIFKTFFYFLFVISTEGALSISQPGDPSRLSTYSLRCDIRSQTAFLRNLAFQHPKILVCLFVRPAWLQLHLSPLYDVLDHTNHTFSESYWSKDIKTDITKCLMHKCTNTNTQVHKYSI